MDAVKDKKYWVAANAGTATPFMTKNRRCLLYCWQPESGAHAHLDLDLDQGTILTEAEARIAIY
jgi:hypothetical protein